MEMIVTEETELSHIITIDRVNKRNSLTPTMLLEIATIINNLSQQKKLKPIVITGKGQDYFCSGYDINLIPVENSKKAAEFALNKPLDLAVKAIIEYPFPTICLLNGSVYGGGCEIAFACDFRYGLPHIELCMPPAKIGLIYSLNGICRIASVIGIQNFKRIILTAKLYSFEKIQQMNAIDEYANNITELNDILEQTLKQFKKLAPLSMIGHKKILNQLQSNKIGNEFKVFANQLIEVAYLSADAREGKKAFLEKRTPIFRGS